MARYLLTGFAHERDRLRRIAAIHDPVTFRHLTHLGVAEGWRCAEVGAGAGSVAEWLSARVGQAGRVLATDLDTTLLAALRLPNAEVRRADLVTDRLEPNEFDLVHARLVLMHVTDRDAAIRNMLAALRPGGWLLVEEPDFSVMRACHPTCPTVEAVTNAIVDAFERAGANPRYGLEAPTALEAAGAVDVVSEADLTLLQFGTERAETAALLFENVGPRLVAAGSLSGDLLATAIRLVRTPAPQRLCSPLIVSTRARRP